MMGAPGAAFTIWKGLYLTLENMTIAKRPLLGEVAAPCESEAEPEGLFWRGLVTAFALQGSSLLAGWMVWRMIW